MILLQISLKAARVNAGFTQSQIAQKLNRDIMTISNWENGKTQPSLSQIATLCQLYNVEFDELRF